MAARYTPADARESVGGDWYDAACAFILSAGDIGHDLDAAAIMGQARSMLRQTTRDPSSRAAHGAPSSPRTTGCASIRFPTT